MNFRVGQKVVCVDASSHFSGVWGGDVPVEGAVYTVKAVGPSRRTYSFGIPCLWLREITNDGDGEYQASRFRPAVERKTDISIFTKMLTDTPRKRATVLSDSE